MINNDLPTPLGSAGGQHGGFSSNGRTNTALGDSVEAALVSQLGWTNLHPGQRQGRLDVTFEFRGVTVGAEVKAVSIRAAEFKVKMKASERAEKVAEAEALGLTPMTVMVIVTDDGRGLVYG